MTTLLACWNCGYENPTDAKYCANCGKRQKLWCPECGAEVTEGAKFCANCGIPVTSQVLGAPSPGPVLTAETRKVVTVVFADLVGSTGLTERLDPEEARDVVGKFYGVVQHAVERFDGTIGNLLGDAVLAVFGLPVAHEDDPERAVRAGLAICDALPSLSEHLAATHGVRLAVRVGVNTGEVVAASGSTFNRDFLVSDAVTTAARFQQTASAGMVVVGERTYRLTAETVDYRSLPPVEVKGKATALAVWEAVAMLPERPDVRRIVAPLIGRHGELGLLHHLYQRSRDDALVHFATVLGQPGVGKSRLLREFLAEVRDTDPQPFVLRGRSVAFGGQIGYHALLDILRGQAGWLDTDSPLRVREKLGTWLQTVAPGSLDLLDGLLLTFGAENGAHATPLELRQHLFDTWRTLITALATTRPTILAFEDVHWADDGELDLIQWVSATTDAIPVLVVCLARPELLERRANWGGGRRNVTTINLPPLRHQEAEQLVAALSSQELTPEMRQRIAQRAEGNPLFVEELVRMILEGSTPGMTIPDTVQAVLTARIDRLPPLEHRVLQAASVFGRTFWPAAVAPLAGITTAETAEAIQTLINKELIVTRPQSTIADEREYAFRHILTRDVAYSMLPKSQRQRAHAEAARWLEARLEERVEEVIEILAEHLRLAGDNAQAAEYLRRAANKARRLYANADAIRLFDQALEAATQAGLSAQQIAMIYRDRGEVRQLLGEYHAAMTDFEHGLAAAREAGDRRLEAGLENRVGLIHHREHRLDDAHAHFTRSIALSRESGDQLTLGQSLVDLANIAWDRGEMRPNHEALVEGLSLLRTVGDQGGLARGLNMLCMAHLGAGHSAAAVAAAQDALAAAREAGDKSKEATSLSYLCVVNGFWGRYREALRHGQDALALADRIGDRRRIAYTMFFLGRALSALGDWGEAIRIQEDSLKLSEDYAKGHRPWPLTLLGFLYQEVGLIDRAKTLFRAGAEIDPATSTWWQPILVCTVCNARLNGDTEALDRAFHQLHTLPWSDFIPAAAEALLPLGETMLAYDRTAELQRFMTARRPELERLGAPPPLAAFAYLQAHLAIKRGAPTEAAAHLEEAVRLSEESEHAILLWRAHELRFELLHRPDDRDALRRLLTQRAASLPADLRESFLATPRVGRFRE